MQSARKVSRQMTMQFMRSSPYAGWNYEMPGLLLTVIVVAVCTVGSEGGFSRGKGLRPIMRSAKRSLSFLAWLANVLWPVGSTLNPRHALIYFKHVVAHVAIVFSDCVLALPDKGNYGNTYADGNQNNGKGRKQEAVLFQLSSSYHCLFAGGCSAAIKSRSSKYLFTVLPFTWAKTCVGP